MKKMSLMKQIKTPDEFQQWARWMWNWQDYDGTAKLEKLDLSDDYIMATGLGGETGEVLEILKKRKRNGKFIKGNLVKELGDVLYYLSMIASRHDITLSEIIAGNIKKLERRKTIRRKKKETSEMSPLYIPRIPK